jgi:aspartyl aminopeptidase
MSQDRFSTELGERFPRTQGEMRELRAEGVRTSQDLCVFIERAPTPYHAVSEVARRLEEAGFVALGERDPWSLLPGDRRYVTRGGTVVAFVVGTESPAVAGFRLIGAHTDSPNLRVKPNADVSRSGYQQVGVEVYGGVLLSTWMDRDLSVAGWVLIERGGAIESELVDLRRPVARIPNLAIHLNRGVNADGLVLNQQKHLPPVLGLNQEISLRRMIARELDAKPDAVLSYDLMLYDTLPPAVGGAENEFVYSARLDNLASSYQAVTALCEEPQAISPTKVVALWDHEECGSRSASGAAGSTLRDVLSRIVEVYPDKQPQAFQRAMAASLLISADMAHAIHPNYADMHEPAHAPHINRGLVIKSNSNQSYATDGASAAAFEQLCRAVGYAPQRFVTRSDLGCGSTIGPITAASLGIATVDVGSPMLSMHSAREMAGTLDMYLAVETFKRFFA